MGGQGFWEGGSHDFQREGRGDQSSATEYKGETIKKLTANLLPLKGGGKTISQGIVGGWQGMAGCFKITSYSFPWLKKFGPNHGHALNFFCPTRKI